MILALRVPADNERGPLHMDQVLSAMHRGSAQVNLSFARTGGSVGLFCRVPDAEVRSAERNFFGQYPEAVLDRLPDDALDPPSGVFAQRMELQLTPDIYPLRRYPEFADASSGEIADPIASILTALSADRGEHESSRIDLQLRPTKPRRIRRAQRMLHAVERCRRVRMPALGRMLASGIVSQNTFVRTVASVALRLIVPTRHDVRVPPSPSARSHDREDPSQAARDKLGRPLFDARIRVTVWTTKPSAIAARQRLWELSASFGQIAATPNATLRPCQVCRLRRRTFLLSSEEVATLWHPPTRLVRAQDMDQVTWRELEPPLDLPRPLLRPDAAVLGRVRFRHRSERFGILPDDRRRHLAVLGKTGMGKSTLLCNLMAADIAAGRSLCLVDPHGDLAEAVLQTVPKRRTNDVILFDAGDAHYPVSFNVLDGGDPSHRDLTAAGVLSAFKKLYGESWGPRLEHILRFCLLTLLEIPGASLASVLPLLSDGHYRDSVVARVRDPVVRGFWEREFAGMPPRLRAEAIAPIQNKVGQFVSIPILRNILLGQRRSAIDLRRVMDDGRILIVNLSKGRIGEDASSLLGSLLITSIQTAAMGRAELAEDDRRDFCLFVDEFQNFATDSFSTILSEARKYRLSLVLATQYLAQMSESTLEAVFGNVGSLMCFQLGARDAELLARQLGDEAIARDMLNLPRYTAYLRLLIDGMPGRPFSMTTLGPQPLRNDEGRVEIIRRISRRRYAQPADRIEAELRMLFAA